MCTARVRTPCSAAGPLGPARRETGVARGAGLVLDMPTRNRFVICPIRSLFRLIHLLCCSLQFGVYSVRPAAVAGARPARGGGQGRRLPLRLLHRRHGPLQAGASDRAHPPSMACQTVRAPFESRPSRSRGPGLARSALPCREGSCPQLPWALPADSNSDGGQAAVLCS
jgi:hypothetical protein